MLFPTEILNILPFFCKVKGTIHHPLFFSAYAHHPGQYVTVFVKLSAKLGEINWQLLDCPLRSDSELASWYRNIVPAGWVLTFACKETTSGVVTIVSPYVL